MVDTKKRVKTEEVLLHLKRVYLMLTLPWYFKLLDKRGFGGYDPLG